MWRLNEHERRLILGVAIVAAGLGLFAFLAVGGGDDGGGRPADSAPAEANASGSEEVAVDGAVAPDSSSGEGSNRRSPRTAGSRANRRRGDQGSGAESPRSPEAAQSVEEGVSSRAGSRPNRNPDHYGPAGKPPSKSAMISEDEPASSDPPNVDPDHYGPGGQPPEPTMTVDEESPATPDSPNRNPDHG
jgi:hypothetical protein